MKSQSFAVAPVIGAACFFLAGTAYAGTLTPVGNVDALTDFSQMGPIAGTAAFDEGPVDQNVPLNLYTPQGLTFFQGDLQAIFPGIVSTGTASPPYYQSNPVYFPQPTKNGGGSYLQLTFQVLDGPYKGRLLWARLNLTNSNAAVGATSNAGEPQAAINTTYSTNLATSQWLRPLNILQARYVKFGAQLTF